MLLLGLLLWAALRQDGIPLWRQAAAVAGVLLASGVLIGEGLSNQEIARKVHVSTATVKTHIDNLFAKTGLKDRAQAVRYAYAKGIVRPRVE